MKFLDERLSERVVWWIMTRIIKYCGKERKIINRYDVKIIRYNFLANSLIEMIKYDFEKKQFVRGSIWSDEKELNDKEIFEMFHVAPNVIFLPINEELN